MKDGPMDTVDIACAPRLVLTALTGVPIVRPGDDLVQVILEGLSAADLRLEGGDVVVVTSKLVSRAEGRFADLRQVEASPRAREVAEAVQKDPRLVEVILQESESISRMAKDVLVVRHRLGFTVANAGIDRSNVDPAAVDDQVVLLLPVAPDESAERIRRGLVQAAGAAIGVVITDSHGRPFRLGTVGAAIGIAGMPALWDQRGRTDLFGRPLQMTITALGDQIAAAADLLAGQGSEGRPVVHVRGLSFPPADGRARDLVRPLEQDLYR
jgi:coenzyme F420-0:L-glutamate ligase/coenzyme F420-1:gamma-L-glutamate ligase